MSSHRNSYWCHSCRRPIRLRGRDSVCLYCNGRFIQELPHDSVHVDPFDHFGLRRREADDPSYGITESFSALLGQQLGDIVYSQDIRSRSNTQANDNNREDPLLILGGVRIEDLFNGDSFIRPGLEELFEQVSGNGGDYLIGEPGLKNCLHGGPLMIAGGLS